MPFSNSFRANKHSSLAILPSQLLDISSDKVVIFVLLKKIPQFEFFAEGPCDLYKFEKNSSCFLRIRSGSFVSVLSSSKSLVTFFLQAARFSRFRKYLEFFSPFSCHLTLLLKIVPLILCSMILFNSACNLCNS